MGIIIAETAYVDRVSRVHGRADPEKPAGGAERIKNVKAARFAKIVERCGPPETHLVLPCEHLTRNQMFAQVIQRDLTSARSAACVQEFVQE